MTRTDRDPEMIDIDRVSARFGRVFDQFSSYDDQFALP